MSVKTSRRHFLVQLGGAAVLSKPWIRAALGEPDGLAARVVIGRDEALTRGDVGEHANVLGKLLDASMQRLTEAASAPAAWRSLFKPGDRVGIKVNTLGRSTHPAVVDAIVGGLLSADVPPQNIIIWDRFDVELADAGFTLNKSKTGVRCYGTDGDRHDRGSGYEKEVESSGRIGSCFSRIISQQVDALISVPVLKDHSLAGVSLGMKNFFGAIHNPNKYHGDNCDPYIVDVVSHRYVRPKWRLTVCDAIVAQCHAGPGVHPGFAWPYGGLLVSTDFVALDAVGADLVETERRARGLNSLAGEKRPAKHIATAAGRGLGVADLERIERVEV